MRNIIGGILIILGLSGGVGSAVYDYISKPEPVKLTKKALKLTKSEPKALQPVVEIKTEKVMTEAEYNKIWVQVHPKCNHCGGE